MCVCVNTMRAFQQGSSIITRHSIHRETPWPHFKGLRPLFECSQAPSENAVVRTVLSTIGALAAVSHSAFRPYVAEVMPLVIDAIQDTGSARKRIVAVKTLGQVCDVLCCGWESGGLETAEVVGKSQKGALGV